MLYIEVLTLLNITLLINTHNTLDIQSGTCQFSTTNLDQSTRETILEGPIEMPGENMNEAGPFELEAPDQTKPQRPRNASPGQLDVFTEAHHVLGAEAVQKSVIRACDVIASSPSRPAGGQGQEQEQDFMATLLKLQDIRKRQEQQEQLLQEYINQEEQQKLLIHAGLREQRSLLAQQLFHVQNELVVREHLQQTSPVLLQRLEDIQQQQQPSYGPANTTSTPSTDEQPDWGFEDWFDDDYLDQIINDFLQRPEGQELLLEVARQVEQLDATVDLAIEVMRTGEKPAFVPEPPVNPADVMVSGNDPMISGWDQKPNGERQWNNHQLPQ